MIPPRSAFGTPWPSARRGRRRGRRCSRTWEREEVEERGAYVAAHDVRDMSVCVCVCVCAVGACGKKRRKAETWGPAALVYCQTSSLSMTNALYDYASFCASFYSYASFPSSLLVKQIL